MTVTLTMALKPKSKIFTTGVFQLTQSLVKDQEALWPMTVKFRMTVLNFLVYCGSSLPLFCDPFCGMMDGDLGWA